MHMEVMPKNPKTTHFEFLIDGILSISDSRGLHATAKTILRLARSWMALWKANLILFFLVTSMQKTTDFGFWKVLYEYSQGRDPKINRCSRKPWVLGWC